MPKAFNRSFISNAALFIFFIFVGTGAGLLLCWWEAFKFKPSITLGQVVQTCVLLLIFLLANHLYAKAHDRRKKKIRNPGRHGWWHSHSGGTSPCEFSQMD